MLRQVKQPFARKLLTAADIIIHIWDYATFEWAYEDDRCEPDCPECAEDARVLALKEKLWDEQFEARHRVILDLMEPLRAQEASLIGEYYAACDALCGQEKQERSA